MGKSERETARSLTSDNSTTPGERTKDRRSEPTSRDRRADAGAFGTPSAELTERMAFSVAETATMLGIGPTIVHELIAREEITSFKINTRRLISRRAIEAFIAGREGR